MNLDLEKREEEYRQTIEIDRRLREERKERVKRELEQRQKQNQYAVRLAFFSFYFELNI